METIDSDKMISKKLLPVSQECAVCTKFGSFSCERCGETYCSKMCQVNDWREHRRICMPIPRLLQRSEMNTFPMNRMLMEPSASGYDATDALGNMSESSAPSESTSMTKEQITQLTKSLNKIQLDNQLKNQRKELKASLTEIAEVLSTPPATPKKVQKEIVQPVPKVDENANYTVASAVAKQPLLVNLSPEPVKVIPEPAKVPVPSPPAPKKKNYNPSMRVIQSKAHAIIVHVENHQTVYVVPTDEQKEWQELIDRTNKYAREAEPLKKAPEPGHIVLAKPKIGDAFSRALIKRVRTQDEIAKAEFLEYGFTEIIKFADMKSLSEELVNTPRVVNQFTLQGIPDDMENAQDVIDFLTDLQVNRKELIVKQLEPIEKSNVGAHFRAILVDAEKFNCINEVVKGLKSIEPQQQMEIVEEIQEPQVTNRRDIEFKGFNGAPLALYVLDNSFMQIGCFSAVQETDMGLLVKNDETVNKHADDIENGLPFHPREGETCLAKSADDNRWYRATVQMKLDGDQYNLIYLDYGNMEAVPSNRIREMKEDFFFPCITSLCFIDGVSAKLSDAAVVNRLKTLIPPYTKIVFDEVVHNGEDAVCKSRVIIKTLEGEGLI